MKGGRRLKKVLILSQTDKDDYALLEWQKNGVDTDITLKDCNKLLRAVRRIWIKFHLPFQHIWYGDWKDHMDEYDPFRFIGSEGEEEDSIKHFF